MQYLTKRKAIGLLLAMAFYVGAMQAAYAVGTASGTVITNTATVDYTVSTNARSASGSVNFTVDNRVDLTVSNDNAGNNVNVSPGATNQVLAFTVTNTGNTTQGYLLSVLVPTASISMTNIRIYIDNGTQGVLDGADVLYTTGTNAGNLAADGIMHVLVVADTPAAATDTSVDNIRLIATTANAGTTTPTSATGLPTAGLDVVFADGTGTASEIARDGKYSAAATYTVSSAALAVSKTIVSTTDEFGSSFAIPGAKVVYQVQVTNSGSAAVDNNTVVVTDPIPAGTKLCFAAACGVPTFTVNTSGLTGAAFEYSTVASPNECANASFTGYVPVDDGTGADPAVTCVRESPTGAMSGSGASFSINYTVIVK